MFAFGDLDQLSSSKDNMKKLMSTAVAQKHWSHSEAFEELLNEGDFINECKWNCSDDDVQ